MQEVMLHTLPLKSRFFIELATGNKIYGTLLSVGRMSASVDVERTKIITVEGNPKTVHMVQTENWDVETMVELA